MTELDKDLSIPTEITCKVYAALKRVPLAMTASELLEVSEAFVSHLGPNGYFPNPGAPLTRRMRAAIAKARGQS